MLGNSGRQVAGLEEQGGRPERRRRFRTKTWLLGVATLLVLFVLRLPLLRSAGDFLVLEERPIRGDAILVLSGSVPDRILEAVDLFHDGFAPRIVLTREPPLAGLAVLRQRGVSLPERHDENRRIAEALGVPPEALEVLPGTASSTYAEAAVVIEQLQERGLQRILLVTSRAHSFRAARIFRTMAAGQLSFVIRPSRHDTFDSKLWWKRRGFARRVANEYAKLMTFELVDRWRGSPGFDSPP